MVQHLHSIFVYFRYADMRMIIGLKISQMWHLLGNHIRKRFVILTRIYNSSSFKLRKS